MKSLPKLSTWTYGQFVLKSALTPAECKLRLKANAAVMDITLPFRTASSAAETRLVLKGEMCKLGLEHESYQKDLAAVMAEGSLTRSREGTRIVVRIGQSKKRITAVVVLSVFWLIAAIVALARLIYTVQ